MGDGFNNPVAAPNGSLILPNMHSPNYAAGASGWTINKDGSAEFNNALFRGQVFVGPVNSQIQIGTNVPALVSAFYAALIDPVAVNTSWIGQYTSASTYRYQVTGLDAFNQPTIGIGFSDGVNVYESRSEKFGPVSGTTEVFTRVGEWAPADWAFYNSIVNVVATDFVFAGATAPNPRADFQINGVSAGRGATVTKQYSGNPINTATGGGAEVSLGNLGIFQYSAHRAYRFECWFTVQASAAAGNLTMRLRRGLGIGGAIDIVRVYPGLSTARFEVYLCGIMITGASPPNQDFTVTAQAAAGSNFTLFATGGAQGQATLIDIAADNAYPGFPAL